jgi:hypothetical protein
VRLQPPPHSQRVWVRVVEVAEDGTLQVVPESTVTIH